MTTSPQTRPVLRVLIGAPGSSKSTWCRRHAGRLGVVLSLDATRAEIGAGEHDQSVTRPAVELVDRRARMHLVAGRDVTIDGTGAAADPDRARWANLARSVRAELAATVFRTPLGVCLERNAARDRVVPPAVVTSMWLGIATTSVEDLRREGFARVDIAEQREGRHERA